MRTTQDFDDPINLILPIVRRQGYVTSILGVSYYRTGESSTLPEGVPLHPVYLALHQLNDAPAGTNPTVSDLSPRVVLVNEEVRFFSILSDGERSIVPPYVQGGDQPYGFVISADSVEDQPGRLEYWFRYVPRDSRPPGV